MSNETVRDIMDLARLTPDELLVDENRDAMWADFGRAVSRNIFHPEDLAWTLTHGSLKAKTTLELVGMVRAYLLTGTKP